LQGRRDGEVLINRTTTGDQQQPGIAGLRGTQFAAVWADRGTTGLLPDLRCDGPVGTEQMTTLDTLTGGQRFSLCAAATSGPAGDTAFLAWGDDSNAGPDKSGHAIEGRALPIPAAGF
jgi:hypothetical protein